MWHTRRHIRPRVKARDQPKPRNTCGNIHYSSWTKQQTVKTTEMQRCPYVFHIYYCNHGSLWPLNISQSRRQHACTGERPCPCKTFMKIRNTTLINHKKVISTTVQQCALTTYYVHYINHWSNHISQDTPIILPKVEG